MHVEMFIKPLFSIYIIVPLSKSRANIDTLREMLKFKVILAVIRLHGYANHYKYRITFFFDYQKTHSKSKYK